MATDPFLGEIKLFAGNFAPTGWATCAGQLLAISQNSALFAILGTQYGGDGVQTFALPDLQCRVPLGAGNEPGLTPRTNGEVGGTESESLTLSQIPAHGHPLSANAAPGDSNSRVGAAPAVADSGQPYSSGTPNATMAAGAVGNAGGGQAHNNMPPFQVIQYIIALQGIFPSRS